MSNPNSFSVFINQGIAMTIPQQQICHAAEVIEEKLDGFEDRSATIAALCDCGDIDNHFAVMAVAWLIDMGCVTYRAGKVWKLGSSIPATTTFTNRG